MASKKTHRINDHRYAGVAMHQRFEAGTGIILDGGLVDRYGRDLVLVQWNGSALGWAPLDNLHPASECTCTDAEKMVGR